MVPAAPTVKATCNALNQGRFWGKCGLKNQIGVKSSGKKMGYLTWLGWPTTCISLKPLPKAKPRPASRYTPSSCVKPTCVLSTRFQYRIPRRTKNRSAKISDETNQLFLSEFDEFSEETVTLDSD